MGSVCVNVGKDQVDAVLRTEQRTEQDKAKPRCEIKDVKEVPVYQHVPFTHKKTHMRLNSQSIVTLERVVKEVAHSHSPTSVTPHASKEQQKEQQNNQQKVPLPLLPPVVPPLNVSEDTSTGYISQRTVPSRTPPEMYQHLQLPSARGHSRLSPSPRSCSVARGDDYDAQFDSVPTTPREEQGLQALHKDEWKREKCMDPKQTAPQSPSPTAYLSRKGESLDLGLGFDLPGALPSFSPDVIDKG